MPTLPVHNGSLLVRTDFADERAWARAVTAAGQENEDDFRAYFVPVSDPAFDGADWMTVKAAVPPDANSGSVLFIADRAALASSEYPFLVVDLLHGNEPFRCIATELWSVENNLNIANMDWDEFARAAGADGEFRGF
jgi:hypothetical protein